MDNDLLNFINLDSLILDENYIKKIENIPIKLKKLHLYHNLLDSISPVPHNNLLFLGDSLLGKKKLKFKIRLRL
jgi:hypothetical protein